MQEAKGRQTTGDQSHPAVELSKQLIRHGCRHDTEWCLAVCSPSITLIGDSRDIFAKGLDEVRHVVLSQPRPTEELFVGSIEATCDQLPCAETVIVTARFLVASNPATGMISASQNRATLVWAMTDNGYKLSHLHLSVPREASGNANPHASVNHETYRYAKALLDQIVRRSAVSIRDTGGTIHYVSDVEVLYIEASRQRSIVHCLNETIVVRRGFKDLVNEFGSALVTIHRSFAVNPAHVKSLRADAVVLDDGSEVPLPQRKSADMRQLLSAAIDRMESSRSADRGSLARTRILDS